jgi:protein gp37
MYGPEPAGMNCFGFTDGFGEEAFLHWVIAGGESGAGHRPMEIDWISNLHEQCVAGDVAFFCKQDAHRYPEQRGRIPYGIWNTKQWPAAMTGGRCLT